MSTTINVVVDGRSGADSTSLLEKSKAQMEANRLQKLESDNRRKVAEQAEVQREQLRRLNGVDTSDKTVKAQADPFGRQPLEEEPGVLRPLGYWFLRPTEPPNANLWFAPYAQAVFPLQTRAGYPSPVTSGTSNSAGLGRPTYLATGGPNNAPAISSRNTQLGSQDLNFPTLSFSGIGLRANRSVRQFTFQLFFQLGSTFVATSTWPEVLVDFAGLVMAFGLETTSGNPTKRFSYGLASGLYNRPNVPAPYEISNVPIGSTAAPDMSPGVWHHAAMTFKDGSAYAFFNGVLLGTSATGLSTVQVATASGSTSINVSFGHTVSRTDPPQAVLVHGVKFEESCRWTTNFTPPPNL